jgi:hypothetical protein
MGIALVHPIGTSADVLVPNHVYAGVGVRGHAPRRARMEGCQSRSQRQWGNDLTGTPVEHASSRRKGKEKIS